MESIVVIVALVILIVVMKKNKNLNNLPEKKQSYEDMREEIGITLSPEREKIEDEKYSEITEQTILDMVSLGYFKPDCMPVIAEKIREKTNAGYRYYNPFDKDDCLTLKEKKEIGLNTKKKYSRELVNSLTEKGLASEDPNDLFQNIWQANFHKISRKYKLQELKALGMKHVKISIANDERDCKAIKCCKKHWLIDEVPELPLPECDAKYCRCGYAIDSKYAAEDLKIRNS